MKKNFFKGAAMAVLALAGFTATAQEEESTSTLPFDLSGSVDAYFRANLNSVNELGEAPGSSFANKNGFALGMANLVASKQVGKVGFVADLVFGPRGTDAVFNSSGSSSIVNQLFVTYAASDAVTFTFGNFNTFLGYEVISPVANFNYSTSYMFSYGPFSHTGLKADFALSDEFSLMAAVMNGTDLTDFNGLTDEFGDDSILGHYTGGLQLGYAVDSGSAYLNFVYGKQGPDAEPLFQVDLTTGWDVSDEFYLGLNATYQDTDGQGFYGVALYPQYAISESFSLGLRGEYLAVAEGYDVGIGTDASGDGSVFATTLTGSFTQGALTIKPELRLDSTSEDSFSDLDGEASKSLASFVVGAVYAF